MRTMVYSCGGEAGDTSIRAITAARPAAAASWRARKTQATSSAAAWRCRSAGNRCLAAARGVAGSPAAVKRVATVSQYGASAAGTAAEDSPNNPETNSGRKDLERIFSWLWDLLLEKVFDEQGFQRSRNERGLRGRTCASGSDSRASSCSPFVMGANGRACTADQLA